MAAFQATFEPGMTSPSDDMDVAGTDNTANQAGFSTSSRVLLESDRNGEKASPEPAESKLFGINSDVATFPEAPHLSYEKYLTMQDKRVVVTIRYSGNAGLKPYFLTAAQAIKSAFPDVLIERRIVPYNEKKSDDENEKIAFDILVDGKVVIGNGTTRKLKAGRREDKSIFISMQDLGTAMARARRKRRPTTAYGEAGASSKKSVRLEMLRRAAEGDRETLD